MSSPVKIAFSTFIKISRQKQDPVYLQIAYQVINAVKKKLLEDGDLLPGSRKLAEELQVHRKTMIAALAELQEQGWVEIVPNKGTFVRDLEQFSARTSNSYSGKLPEKAEFPFRKEFYLDMPFLERKENLLFTDGTPDFGMIKVQELLRVHASVVKRTVKRGEWHQHNRNEFFRDQLSNYLNLSRGFQLSREFLLPVAGREQVFSILSRLLINRGDLILVEELSFYMPNMIFGQAGAKIKTVPVDEEGMDVNYVRKQFQKGQIRLVFLNSRSQYPTTVSLSKKRKEELLELANEYDFIIIEDDPDFEFSGSRERDFSLFKMDGVKRLIYTGIFGAFLTPGFQMCFLIAPKDLLQEADKYRNIFGKPNFLIERALGEMIYQGDIHRYQRKVRKVIMERKETFSELLKQYFGEEISFEIPVAGLAFWVWFREYISLTKLQETSRQKGLFISASCLYQNKDLTALRLGFAHLNPQEMPKALAILHEAYMEERGKIRHFPEV